jgi:hypothetical protein
MHNAHAHPTIITSDTPVTDVRLTAHQQTDPA